MCCSGPAPTTVPGIRRWARENGCPWNTNTCTEAADAGHLDILQWVWAHGCPWDRNVCTFAARSGRLASLQWARENGCPWDRTFCLNIAKKNGHSAVAVWIETQPE